MNRIFLIMGIISCSLSAFCQDRQIYIPSLSPFQKTEVKVGIVDLKLEYCRPSMRGRKIFGGLETYGEIWRTGANKNTKFTCSEKVIVGGIELAAGSYSIFTKPNIAKWEVYFYTELDKYGVPDVIDSTKIVAQFTVPSISLNRRIETLSIAFENLSSKSANLAVAWEQTLILIPIEIPSSEIISATIEEEVNTLISDYWAASSIYLEIEKDYAKALESINASIALIEKGNSFEAYTKVADLSNRHIPNKYLLKSEIYAALGEYEKAIEAAKRSFRLAELVNDKYYKNRNKTNLSKWKKQQE